DRSTNTPVGYDERIERIWRADITGTPGTVDLCFNRNALPGLNPDPSKIAVLTSTSSDFSAATDFNSVTITDSTVCISGVMLNDGDYFTLALPLKPNPTGCSSEAAVAWYKADAGVDETSGTLNSWIDQAVGYTSTPVTGTVLFEEDFINGYAAVDFGTGNNRLDADLEALRDGGSYSLYVIGQRVNNAAGYVLGGNNNTRHVRFGYSGNTTAYFANYTTNPVSVTVPAFDDPTESPFMLMGQMELGASRSIRELRDGTETSNTVATGTALTTGATNDYIGYGWNSYFDGHISEVIAFSDALDATERNKVESYLGIKYGMSLDQTTPQNYVDGQNNTIWDGTLNALYNNDITGIGIDTCTGLNQLQSKSVNSSAVITISNPSTLDGGDFVVFGDDGASTINRLTDVPAAYDERIQRVWRADITGTPGTVNLCFDRNALPGLTVDESLTALLTSSTPVFAAATDFTNVTISDSTVCISGVTLNDGDYFTLALPLKPNPAGCSSEAAVVWYKTDAGLSETGGAFDTWIDQSLGNTTTISSGDPQVSTDFLNGYDAVDLDGNDRLLTNLDAIRNGGSYSLYFVGQPRDNVPGYAIGGANTNSHVRFGYSGNTTAYFANYNANPVQVTVPAFPSPNLSPIMLIGEVDVTGSERSIRELRNSVETSNTITTATALGLSGTTDYIGYANNRYFDGHVTEVIAFADALDANEKARVESYLAIKYGLSLDQTTPQNYVDGQNNTIFDNTGYTMNVTGIGQDNCLGLNQSISRTANIEERVITISSPSTLEDGDYLVFGDNGLTLDQVPGTPAPYTRRLER
ncbi:MAG: hypothetical protein AAF599_10545, partial [Bacteroidota bacterium]